MTAVLILMMKFDLVTMMVHKCKIMMGHSIGKRGCNHSTPLPSSPSKRGVIEVRGKSFTDSKPSSEMTIMIGGFLNVAYTSWSEVPKEVRDYMFDKFKERYQWPNHIEQEVRRAWDSVAGNQVKQFFYNTHRDAEKEMKMGL